MAEDTAHQAQHTERANTPSGHTGRTGANLARTPHTQHSVQRKSDKDTSMLLRRLYLAHVSLTLCMNDPA